MKNHTRLFCLLLLIFCLGLSACSVERLDQDPCSLPDPTVPEGCQPPADPDAQQIDPSVEQTCYLTISCATILDNMEDLTPGKEPLVPEDGMLLDRVAVTFHPGESAFDLLQRETRNRKLHLEYNTTPLYQSAYIKGICNLYEFDCGPNSGWIFRVNGWQPNYGVSRYLLQPGDEIELLYTCDLGRDLGADWTDGL